MTTSDEVPGSLDADDILTAAHGKLRRGNFTRLLTTSVSRLASAGSAVYRHCGGYRGWRWGARIGSYPLITTARGDRIGRRKQWRVK